MIRKLLANLTPPPSWRMPVILLMGIFFGLAAYAAYIARLPSYFSDSPETCVNCHVMAPQYATWSHSSHREVATCVDCHVPHDSTVKKYYFKAKDGLRHATIFTLRKEPQVIQIKEEGIHVVQENCIHCHENLVVNDRLLPQTTQYADHFKERLCWDCHREMPHGRVNSLSSVPNARVPLPQSPRIGSKS